MENQILMIERDYVTMETLKAGNYLAVRKEDYDRTVFLTEVYGSSLSIPETETVPVIPILERRRGDFEIASTGGYLIAMKDIKLTTVLKSSIPEIN